MKRSAIEVKQAKEASARKGTAGRRDHKQGAPSSNKGTGGKLAM
ncbi:MAG TPA: hypothetical protein VEA36_03805 [Candidatus Paceibacterota bacterium]|nr:hypothetical protein [Candidatus Paceibacterota bacterium]